MADLQRIFAAAQRRQEAQWGMKVADEFMARPKLKVKGVKLAKGGKPEPKPEPKPKPETVPEGLEDLRLAVIDYFENPNKSIDMDSGVRENEYYFPGEGYEPAMIFKFKSLEKTLGIEKLGRGHYSDVYAIDDKRALKIVKRGDSGYARFVKDVVRKDPSNPYLPKVYYTGEWAGKTVYIIERLSTDPETLNREEVFSEFKAALRLAKSSAKFITISDDDLRRAGQMLLDNNLFSDLHSDNLMFRGDVPVITDPASD